MVSVPIVLYVAFVAWIVYIVACNRQNISLNLVDVVLLNALYVKYIATA